MNDEWRAEIAKAQLETHETIAGRQYPRVRQTEGRCADCGVDPGQLHVFGCDQEPCPACGCQNIGCSCYGADEALH